MPIVDTHFTPRIGTTALAPLAVMAASTSLPTTRESSTIGRHPTSLPDGSLSTATRTNRALWCVSALATFPNPHFAAMPEPFLSAARKHRLGLPTTLRSAPGRRYRGRCNAPAALRCTETELVSTSYEEVRLDVRLRRPVTVRHSLGSAMSRSLAPRDSRFTAASSRRARPWLRTRRLATTTTGARPRV